MEDRLSYTGCPLHTWLWQVLGGRALWQPPVQVTLPHLVCALLQEWLLLRGPGAAKAPGFVGSCHVHPSRSHSAGAISGQASSQVPWEKQMAE